MTPAERLEAAIAADGRDLLAYFARRVGPADAGDLLGETLLVAWRRVRSLPEPPQQARMWLFGVARNVLANGERSRRRRERLAARIGTELLAVAEPPPGEDALAVRAAVDALPEDQRELIRLMHWDGFRIGEAADLLGISAATARRRYASARAVLAEALGEPQPADGDSQYSVVSP